MKEKNITVEKKETLLKILSEAFPDFSNKKIKSLIKYKMVEVDNKPVVNSSTSIEAGKIVTVFFQKRAIPKIDLNIIYEDDDLIAIDKPAGLLSISNSKEKEVTAFRLVSDYIKISKKSAKLFVVHRLDQGTSGVLLFSKNQKLKEELQKNWNDIVYLREYIAVVSGKVEKSGTIESYLTMNHFQIVHSTKNKEIGNYAKTNYKLIKYKNRYSLLEVNIETGRRNQIRVHMSEAGHPVVGDKKYGSRVNPINRLALHSSKLYLKDPRSGKMLKLESKVPEEITNLVK